MTKRYQTYWFCEKSNCVIGITAPIRLVYLVCCECGDKTEEVDSKKGSLFNIYLEVSFEEGQELKNLVTQKAN